MKKIWTKLLGLALSKMKDLDTDHDGMIEYTVIYDIDAKKVLFISAEESDHEED